MNGALVKIALHARRDYESRHVITETYASMVHFLGNRVEAV